MDLNHAPKSTRESMGHMLGGVLGSKSRRAVQILRDNRQLVSEGVSTLTLKTLHTGLSFATTLVLARLMGAAEFGIYSYAYALVNLVTIPAQAGLPNLVVRETARGLAEGRPDVVKGIWRWSGGFVGSLTLSIAIVGGLSLFLAREQLQVTLWSTLGWAIGLIPVIALCNLVGGALRGLDRIAAGQLPEFVLRPGLFFLLLIVAGYLTGRPPSAPFAMSMHAAAASLAFIAGTILWALYTPTSVRHSRPSYSGRSWLGSSVLFALLVGFQILNRHVSVIILGSVRPSDQVGIFYVAVQAAMLASIGLQVVNLVVAPRFADLYARKKMQGLQRLVTWSARVAFTFNLILTIGFAIAGKQLLSLAFGPQFAPAFPALMILLVGQMVNSMTGAVSLLLNMTGHERATVTGMGIAAATNIILSLVLSSSNGILGAAMASAISMTLWNVLLWLSVRKRLGINSIAFVFPGMGSSR